MTGLNRLFFAFLEPVRADVIMNPIEMIWDAIGGRLIAIALVSTVVIVTAILILILKRKIKENNDEKAD